MGYCAHGGGTVTLKNSLTEDDYEKLYDILRNHISGFDEASHDPDGIHLYQYGHYIEELIYESLIKLVPFVESSELEFVGEDDSRWLIKFEDGVWKEYEGHVVYDKLTTIIGKGDQNEAVRDHQNGD